MPEQIKVNDNVLNLAQLQGKMDEIVFEHLDTSHNYKIAYDKLDGLLNQAISYFTSKVESENGQLPSTNVYWVLFMDIAAKLIYFKTVAQKQLANMNNKDEKEAILTSLTKAVNCLPNIQKGNYELLQEISEFYEEIELFNGRKGDFEQYFYTKNNELQDCLREFYEFVDQDALKLNI